MISLKRLFAILLFLGVLGVLGKALAMGDLGPVEVPFKLLKNWECEVVRRSEQNLLIARGFNVESARWVSRVKMEVQVNNVIVEVYSAPLYPWTKVKNAESLKKRSSEKPISFEKEVVLPTPLASEYSVYYRDIDKQLHLITKVRSTGNI